MNRRAVGSHDGVRQTHALRPGGMFSHTGAAGVHPDDRAWDCSFADPGFDDVVIHALAKSDERLYAGGDFARIGSVAGKGIAVREGGTWKPLGDGLRGTVSAIAVDGDEVFAAGTFYMAGNAIARGIARWDGAGWSPLGTGKAGVDGTILALAVAGDSVFVGGFIREAGGTTVSGIAVWNRKDGRWGALEGGVVNALAAAVVRSIVVSGDAVYVGGNFTSAGGIETSNIARWNRRTGAWEALQDGSARGVDGGVTSMVEADGDLAVFGGFIHAGSILAARAAVWHPGSNQWTALGGGIPSAPTAALRVGEDFIAACPDSSNRRWRLFRWGSGSWDIFCNAVEGAVQALAETDDDAGIVMGGSFTAVEGIPLRSIAHWDGSSWGRLDEPPAGARSAVVNAVAAAGQDIYVGGAFSTAGGRPARSIARWNPNRALWEPLGPDTADGVLGEVHSILADEDRLFVGGFFFRAGPSNAAHIARWEPATKTWHPLFPDASLQPDGGVRALVSDGDVLYVGGDFTRIDTFSVLGLAAWDKRTGVWSRIDEGLEVKYRELVVEAMTFADGNLYVAGYFEPHEGMGGTAVLRRERNAWYIVAEDVPGTVEALCAAGEDLYIGGVFDSIGGIAALNIARWNKRRLMFSPLGTGMDGAVTALATDGVQVYAGGEFSEAGGVHASGIARWDGTQWHPLGSGVDGPVYAMCRRGGDLFLGGSFLQAGACRAVRAAHWDDTALPVEALVPFGAEIELAAAPMPLNGPGFLAVTARRPASVRIHLFDMKGSRALDVFTGSVGEGTTRIPLDASRLSSGVYTVVLFHEKGLSLLPVIVLGR